MKLTFLGATHEVTGSCTMIEVNGHLGLVDCGMEQGRDVYENVPLPVPAGQIEFTLLTHAHMDHSGLIPLLYKNGYNGLVYATGATCCLTEIMLEDGAHIQESEAEYKTKKNLKAGKPAVEPLFTREDVDKAMGHFRPCSYNKEIEVADGVVARFRDAGHLLGSASIEIWLTEGSTTRKVVFSGDIGNFSQPVIRDPDYITEADYVITESTYGDRMHEIADIDNIHYLANCIQRTLDRGGTLMIPAFAVGRTQDMLFYIRQIKVAGLVTGYDDFKVYVDSPLANKATGIFLQIDREYMDEETLALVDQGINPLMSPGVIISESVEESKAINSDPSPKVVISASGMCDAGRIRHHLKHNLSSKDNTVLFVGYQANGTLGRILLDGIDKVKLFGEEIAVNAEICFMPGKSGHADKDGLLRWINSFEKKPRTVFVNHGDSEVCDSYVRTLHDGYGFAATAPYSGAEFDLLAGEYTSYPDGVPVEK